MASQWNSRKTSTVTCEFSRTLLTSYNLKYFVSFMNHVMQKLYSNCLILYYIHVILSYKTVIIMFKWKHELCLTCYVTMYTIFFTKGLNPIVYMLNKK